eukprot:13835-Pleurochrysis_carterae.AAC.1
MVYSHSLPIGYALLPRHVRRRYTYRQLTAFRRLWLDLRSRSPYSASTFCLSSVPVTHSDVAPCERNWRTMFVLTLSAARAVDNAAHLPGCVAIYRSPPHCYLLSARVARLIPC